MKRKQRKGKVKRKDTIRKGHEKRGKMGRKGNKGKNIFF